MNLQERINVLVELGNYIKSENETIHHVMEAAYLKNKWFTVSNQEQALNAIVKYYLSKDLLQKWASHYEFINDIKKIALIPAGNIPLVGFHDVLCIFLSGHSLMIKYSDKDGVLTPFIVKKLADLVNQASLQWTLDEVDQLKDFDAVIATGSNNTARYFDYYFGKYPHIIRKNRNGIAVLNGQETADDLLALGRDVFQYFGLGCRNISKLYLPIGYDFDKLLEALYEYKEVMWHEPYKNNFDYNYAVHSLGKEPFMANGCILIKEAPAIPSRIGILHFEYYDDLDQLKEKLSSEQEHIQCLMMNHPFDIRGIESFNFGEAQNPNLQNYADGVDTMSFLTSIK